MQLNLAKIMRSALMKQLMKLLAIPLSPKVRGKRLVIANRLERSFVRYFKTCAVR